MVSSAKRVRIAPAATTAWVTLPGNTADFNAEADMLDDTIFGVAFKSMQPDIRKWSMSSNAIYKGTSGYQAIIKKTGSPITMTDEPMVLLSALNYQITDAAKRLIHVGTTVIVEDNNVDHTADVESIDFLFGIVKFSSGYVVTGPVTITGAYLPAAQICAMNKFTLNQQADSTDNTDLCLAQTNGGYRQYQMGLKSVSLSMQGFYRAASGFLDILTSGAPLMVEVNPDGAGRSTARGFFIAKSDKESGKVGAIEEENVDFDLYVPDNPLMLRPFGWRHSTTTTMNMAVQTLLSAWENGVLVEARYLEDGTTGKQGSAVPTNLSLSGGLGALNEFTVQLQGSGSITVV